jgi:hypothetical protein
MAYLSGSNAFNILFHLESSQGILRTKAFVFQPT